MIDADILTRVIAVEGVLLGALLLLLFGHAVQLDARRRWTTPRLTRARHELVRAAAGGSGELYALQALSPSLQTDLFLELAPSLAGPERAALGALGASLGVVDRAAQLARSRLEMRRLHGARLLTALQAGHPLLVALLRDPSPWVRAQAAEAALHQPETAVIEQLIRLLRDEAPLCRFAAKDTLLRLEGRSTMPLLEFLADEEDPAAVQTALEVAVGLTDPRLLHMAIARSTAEGARTRELCAQLLAGIGGAAAVDRLLDMLDDPSSDVKAAAATGLAALGHWPAATRIAELTRDPHWETRRAAGLALRALGSAGELLLRRQLGGDDAYAAEMARHVLDLPRATSSIGRPR